MIFTTAALLATSLLGSGMAAQAEGVANCNAKRPNIVFIFTDDQDLHLNSLNYMKTVKSELIDKGTMFSNHFATVSLCCPSRASLFRGQHGHNTNITSVRSPGGNYQKWRLSGENKNYLPFWLGQAGYRTEYIGKFLNGYTRALYEHKPEGWDFIDALVDPFTYEFNTPVFSKNGERPILYRGYHQTDVIRAKALSRLHYLTESQDKPFYLTIAPASPHNAIHDYPTPLKRHMKDFKGMQAPRPANFNPSDELTAQKPSWLKHLKPLEGKKLDQIDTYYRRRIQALQGVDEIVDDVLHLLKEKQQLDNTYIVFSSDNGYHLGQHRVFAGKTLPYIEDTNVPLIVRGPKVPHGAKSRLPGTHLDLAPTFLDIACIDRSEYPVFFDGRSLLDDWHHPANSSAGLENRDIINVEFWGSAGHSSTSAEGKENNSYKTLRLVGEKTAYLYSKWCTGESELYNTLDDPFELHNLAKNPDMETRRLIHRLNGLLLVTKSCRQDHCRNPWSVLQSSCEEHNNCPTSGEIFSNFQAAMDAKYDTFFKSLPHVQFKECMEFQDADNEEPYLPASSRSLGRAHRLDTDNYQTPNVKDAKAPPANDKAQGTKAQRHDTVKDMMKKARKLTDAELGHTTGAVSKEEEIAMYDEIV
ncbi:hypothetical protein NM208_g6860 [Fusarium decemcellulare]|uniref:Uncharacterized protein n=1 Tax=Fusarium decemcellulare TaxID=57161 RepID=A0ACC1SBK1_9HYPO|nr:hypothetical protein NM208_g6860 [Fusarium decemcellulare]